MSSLDRKLRKELESAIKEARIVSLAAAKDSLRYLGVGFDCPSESINEKERDLGQKLRERAKEFSAPLANEFEASSKTQLTDSLAEEIAYERWHNRLMGRYLAENGLLMNEDLDKPGLKNPIPLTFEVKFAPKREAALEKILAKLPREVFTVLESLGWVYQYWQALKKAEINRSGQKIGAKELPVVTQLFTEPYMVSFLLDNTLGAWWAARRLSASDLATALTEDELRAKAALPGVPLQYLRFVREEGLPWAPAAGTFESWPEKLSDLKILDPCCGSGHFLVAALTMMASLRSEAEGLSPSEAIEATLRDNIYGLEIDPRCVAIAAFALAMAARNFPESGGYRVLPNLNIACSGIPIKAELNEWLSLAEGDAKRLEILKAIYGQFKEAPLLGSLITLNWEEDYCLEKDWLAIKESEVSALMAEGTVKAVDILTKKYHLVITNAPFLGRGKQSEELKKLCAKLSPEAKFDLATVFLERSWLFCQKGGIVAIITPQNWLSLKRYTNFRQKTLRETDLRFVVKIGEGGFDSFAAQGAFVTLIGLSVNEASKIERGYLGSERLISFIDATKLLGPQNKAKQLINSRVKSLKQDKQLKNPEARIAEADLDSDDWLQNLAISYTGLQSGDTPRMKFCFWEFQKPDRAFIYFQSSVKACHHFGGLSWLLRWEDGEGTLVEIPGSVRRGEKVWGKLGIAVSQMRDLPVSLYFGAAFDNNAAVIMPKDQKNLAAIWTYSASPDYSQAVRRIDSKINVTSATLVKIPFDLEKWAAEAKKSYPNGLPKPYSNDPTQWIFHGHPCGSVIWDSDKKLTAKGSLRYDTSVLQVAVARLLGYHWPAELDPTMDLALEQRELVALSQELNSYADEDGLVCLPAVVGAAPATDRLRSLLAAAYGAAWSTDLEAKLLRAANFPGQSLENWLRNGFCAQHFKLFHNRPFIWQIWDGRVDGFSALVNYHKFDRKLLESLCFNYLADWLNRQHFDLKNKVEGAIERLEAAKFLHARLQAILEGEAPYDIFVRWKRLNEQPLGWNPDLNDGIRLNIRPFLTGPDIGRKDSGLLRDSPNIKWEKDRGKEIETSPWYNLFKGERINDHHLSLEDKEKARG